MLNAFMQQNAENTVCSFRRFSYKSGTLQPLVEFRVDYNRKVTKTIHNEKRISVLNLSVFHGKHLTAMILSNKFWWAKCLVLLRVVIVISLMHTRTKQGPRYFLGRHHYRLSIERCDYVQFLLRNFVRIKTLAYLSEAPTTPHFFSLSRTAFHDKPHQGPLHNQHP